MYGQGWASCNPDLSNEAFGLKCQRLQVGDICISLIMREQSVSPSLSLLSTTATVVAPTTTTHAISNVKLQQPQIQYSPSYESAKVTHLQPSHFHKNHHQTSAVPQNLSRKIQHNTQSRQITSCSSSSSSNLISTIATPTHAGQFPDSPTATIVNSGYSMHPMPLHLMPSTHLQHQPQHPYADMTEIVAAYENASNAQISRNSVKSTHLPSPHGVHHPFYQQHSFHPLGGKQPINNEYQLSLAAAAVAAQHKQQQQQYQNHSSTSPRLAPPQSMSEPISVHTTRCPSTNNHIYYETPPSSADGGDSRHVHFSENDHDQDQPVDASMSRKRRWSAPESICDDDEVPPDQQEQQPKPQQEQSQRLQPSYKTYITNPSS